MNINLNGQLHRCASPVSLVEFLINQGYDLECKFAVAINGHFVPKSTYQQTQLTEHDALEIVSPMQGG